MSKKNFGWVLYDTNDSQYVGGDLLDIADCLYELQGVFSSREDARRYKLFYDRILKVSLDTNGRPVAVIGRG